MIVEMSGQPLEPLSTESESGTRLPLIVASIAAVLLCWSFLDRARAIPRELLADARGLLAEASLDSVEASIDGRELSLSGELMSDTVDPADLADRLSRLPGVTSVRSDVSVIDPERQLATDLEEFVSRLRQLDTAAVRFEMGSSSLLPDSADALQALSALMQRYPAFRVRIAGHTDATGSADMNLRISRERATAVATQLVARGIDRERIIATGYGATQPIADNTTDAGRARNRRIEVSYVN